MRAAVERVVEGGSSVSRTFALRLKSHHEDKERSLELERPTASDDTYKNLFRSPPTVAHDLHLRCSEKKESQNSDARTTGRDIGVKLTWMLYADPFCDSGGKRGVLNAIATRKRGKKENLRPI